ncbi:MAG: translation initiation factor IF-3, partial [Sarcina sp.]
NVVGTKILNNFLGRLEEVCSVEKPAKLEGRNMTMILAPKKA